MDGVWKDARKLVYLVFVMCLHFARRGRERWRRGAVIGFLLIIVTNLLKTRLYLTFIVTKNFAWLLFS